MNNMKKGTDHNINKNVYSPNKIQNTTINYITPQTRNDSVEAYTKNGYV